MSVSRTQPGKSPDQLRRERAVTQFHDYSRRLAHHPAVGTYIVLTKKSDETEHVVTPRGCSCEDFTRRQEPCKHLRMVELWLGGETPPLPEEALAEALEREARTQQALRDRETLWEDHQPAPEPRRVCTYCGRSAPESELTTTCQEADGTRHTWACRDNRSCRARAKKGEPALSPAQVDALFAKAAGR